MLSRPAEGGAPGGDETAAAIAAPRPGRPPLRVIGSVSAKIATPSRPSLRPRASRRRGWAGGEAGTMRPGLGFAPAEPVHSARDLTIHCTGQRSSTDVRLHLRQPRSRPDARGGQHLTEQLGRPLAGAHPRPAAGAACPRCANAPAPRGQPDHGGGGLRPTARAGLVERAPARFSLSAPAGVDPPGAGARPGGAGAAHPVPISATTLIRRHVPAARRPADAGPGHPAGGWLDRRLSAARCAR